MKTPTPSMINSLLQTPLFNGIATQTYKDLSEHTTVHNLPKKSHLIYCGEPLSYCYFLVSGKVKLYRISNEGEEKVFYVVGTNQFFFEAQVFSKQPTTPFSVLASETSTLLQLPLHYVLALVKRDTQLSLNFLKQLSSHYYQTINRIDILSTSNATQRLVLYLFDLASTCHSMKFSLPLTQKCVARQLNITPETLSRIIKKLCDNGFIEYDNSHITILYPNKMKSYFDLPVSECCCQSNYSSFC